VLAVIVALLVVVLTAVPTWWMAIEAAHPVHVEQVHVLSPDSHRDNALKIVALGDSFMAGEGTGHYLVGTDEGVKNYCHRSDRAYPVLVAEALRNDPERPPQGAYGDVHLSFAACSGAVTTNIGTEFTDPDAQDAAAAQFHDQPLQIKTLEEHPDADVVLLGVGGNDAGFSEAVLTCSGRSTSRTCEERAGTWLSTVRAEGEIPVAQDDTAFLLPKLRDVMRQIRSIAPAARYYVTTYPNPISAPSCPQLDLSRSEVSFITTEFLPALNAGIEFAAAAEGFEAVPLEDAFKGRGLCAKGDEASGEAMNGWRAQRVRPLYPGLNPQIPLRGSVHPTAEGHQLIAEQVEKQVRAGLTRPAPNVLPGGCMSLPPDAPPLDGPPSDGAPSDGAPSDGAPSDGSVHGEPGADPDPVQGRPGVPGATPGPDDPTCSLDFPPNLPPRIILGSFCQSGDLTWYCDRPTEPTVVRPDPPPDDPDGPPSLVPPVPETLGPNPCTREEPFYVELRMRTEGPLTVTDALPRERACYKTYQGEWQHSTSSADGRIEVDTGPAVRGDGGRRELLYQSVSDGTWVWILEHGRPDSPDSDLDIIEAWSRTGWVGEILYAVPFWPRMGLLAGGLYLIGLGLSRGATALRVRAAA
jgi:lysophospholipase L1-like esterase